MAWFTELFSGDITSILSKSSTFLVVAVVIGIIVIFSLIGLVWWYITKRKWNLKVEYKMVRSDGRVTIPEWGSGKYDAKNGIVWLKRKKKRAEAVKAQRLDKYLQGSNTLTAVGNPGNWRLVIPDTFIELMDDDTGEIGAVINLRADTKEDKSWATNFERMALGTFTIQTFMSQYGQFLGWSFILLVTIIANFVGFSIVLGKINP